MSDKQIEADISNDAEFPVEDTKPAETTASSNGVAWLAILLSAIAMTAVAYTLFEDWRTADNDSGSEFDNLAVIENLERRIGDFDDSLTALETRIEKIPHPDYSGDFDAVRRDVDEQLRLLNSLPSRISNVESSVASLAGISAGARETFLLAEGEYYLQIANAQLQLANNPRLASLALGIADERVTQLSDPALTAVRRAISDELALLDVMEKPDLEGATLALASLARVVESLPVANSAPQDDDDIVATDPEQGNIDQAWGSVKGALSGLVKVTRPDQATLALISPDAEYFLRNNIALQLQSARLALLRGEQAIFEQTLADTTALIDTYFDVNSAQVISAQQTIAEIRENVFTVSVPDISGSLRLLRQYQTLRETSE